MKINNHGDYYSFNDGISKTNKISFVSIIDKTSKNDLTLAKVMTKMLKHTTKTYERQELALKCAEFYDIKLNIATADMFNYIILEHNMTYISADYANGFDFSDAIKLFSDYMENDHLLESDFKQVIKSLKVELSVLKNDYTKLARRLSRDLVYGADPLYQTLNEYENQIKSMSLEDIKAFYANTKHIKEYILHKTNTNEEVSFNLTQNDIDIKRYNVQVDGELKQEYNLNIDQAKVNVIYNIDKEYPREVLSIFNLIFGGDSFSKLFVNVREAHSICYSINSQVVNRDFIQVQTGVNADNIELACNLIDEQLSAIKNGDITELQNAKDKLLSLYQAIENDYPSRKNLMERNILYKENTDVQEIIANVQAVKIEDVIEVAKGLSKIKEVIMK